jgi:hypothetical protein
MAIDLPQQTGVVLSGLPLRVAKATERMHRTEAWSARLSSRVLLTQMNSFLSAMFVWRKTSN